jgi:hypothetical protein
MKEDPVQDKLGSNAALAVTMGIALLVFSACTPIYKCKLLNATKDVITAIGGRHPVHLRPGEVKLVMSVTNELKLIRGEKTLRFSLTKVPQKHVQAKSNGWIIHAVLQDDNHLYLGKPAEARPVVPLELQPSPFPLSPDHEP